MDKQSRAASLDISINKDLFLRNLIRELAGSLEDVVGLEEASGFISIVGQQIGDWMDAEYRKAFDTDTLTPEQIRDVLIDLKLRINGEFYLIEEDENKIVLGNHHCPFGSKVKDRPSMCMMTSNVFGTVTAENLGYAKVCLHETIANGSPECKVTVYKSETEEAREQDGRVYYKS